MTQEGKTKRPGNQVSSPRKRTSRPQSEKKAGIRKAANPSQGQQDLEAAWIRYADLYDLSPVGCFTLDRNGFIIGANLTGASMLTVERSALVRRPFTAFLHRPDQDTFFMHLKRVFQSGKRECCELRLRSEDGSPFVGLMESIAVPANAGDPGQCYTALSDVTERRQAEEALRESEERYRALIENSPEGIVIHRGGRLTYANPAALRLVGASDGKALIGKGVLDFVHPDYREIVSNRIKQVVEEGVQVPLLEIKILRVNGQTVDVEALSGPITYLGEPAVQAVMRDITDRRRAIEAMKESREDLQRAQAVARTGSWRLHVRRNELLWSNEAYRIFGIPMETPLTYEAFLSSVHPGDREYVDVKWRAALRGEPYDIEHRIVVGNDIKWVRERAELEFDDKGGLLGGFGTVQDITGRKKAEEELERYRRYLETLVKERTADLLRTNRELEREITERKKADAALSGSEHLLGTVLEHLPVGVWIVDESGQVVHGNPTSLRIWAGARYVGVDGYGEYKAWWADSKKRIEPEEWGAARALRNGETSLDEEIEIECFDGSRKVILNSAAPIWNDSGKVIGAVVVNQDITERKGIENQVSAMNALLRLFPEKKSRNEYLDCVTAIIGSWSGCRCVGIRILDGNNRIPYKSSVGFSREFLESESNLLLGENHCVCTRIIEGSIEPQEAPAMTAAGSFWSGNIGEFFAHPAEDEKDRYRGVCVRSGFSSIALIPIQYREMIIGAIHLADERPDMVSPRSVEFLETMSPLIGEAIHRFTVEEELLRGYEALGQTNELLENMFSNIHMLIAYLDRDFNFIRVNRRYAEADGRDPDFYPGENHFDLFPNDENERIFAEVVRTGRPYHVYEKPFEYPYHPGRGITYWDWSLQPIKDASGRVTGLVLSLLDVTERRQAQEALQRSEEHFRSLIENVLDVIVLLDEDGNILYGSPSIESTLGYRPQEIEGACIFDYIAPEDIARIQGIFAAGVRIPGYSASAEVRFRHGDGSYRTLEGKGKNLLHNPSVRGIVVNLRDITGRRIAEAEAMKTARLASIGELAAGVAHEINNPINGIINYAQLLADKVKEGSIEREVADRIIREGDRIAGIVKSLLSFARERNEEKVPCRVGEILSDSISLIGAQLRKNAIHLGIESHGDIPEILANPQQIEQVFLNIISNSQYALNEKYPRGQENKILQIAVRTIEAEGKEFVRVTFHDRGVGIPEAVMDRVMTPFFSTKPLGVGTGLGLSISHGIVSSHGGRMQIQSSEGEFTNVILDLPTVDS